MIKRNKKNNEKKRGKNLFTCNMLLDQHKENYSICCSDSKNVSALEKGSY